MTHLHKRGGSVPSGHMPWLATYTQISVCISGINLPVGSIASMVQEKQQGAGFTTAWFNTIIDALKATDLHCDQLHGRRRCMLPPAVRRPVVTQAESWATYSGTLCAPSTLPPCPHVGAVMLVSSHPPVIVTGNLQSTAEEHAP